jgi:hypothetical protein
MQASGEKLSFKQYLYGFVIRAKPLLSDKTFLKSVFDVSAESLSSVILYSLQIIFLQFFDKDGNGLVNMSDISKVLPVTKLPEVKVEKVRRRRGSRQSTQKGEELAEHIGTALEEEETNMDFSEFQGATYQFWTF